jgi:hypothetical protein
MDRDCRMFRSSSTSAMVAVMLFPLAGPDAELADPVPTDNRARVLFAWPEMEQHRRDCSYGIF